MSSIENTQFIFVHGLASKPSEEKLHELWRRSLIANLSIDRPDAANYLNDHPESMTSAYWANCIPDHIEDSSKYVKDMSVQVDEVIKIRKKLKNELHIGKGGISKHTSKLKKFAIGIANALGRGLTIKDNVIEKYMREVRLYHGDQYIADRIRLPLEDALREAWDAGKEVFLLTHSMGTFISYDVLWRFSHRSEKEYKSYRSKKVRQFITMGSPLGDEALRSFMLTDRWKDAPKESLAEERKRYFPMNIEAWYNFSAIGDVVCHDSTLEDDFFKVMKDTVSQYKKADLRDYTKLYNPYVNTDGKQNPHKSYGYLIQPKLSQRICSALRHT